MARPLLLGAVALRGVLGVLAVPLAPALYRDHFLVVVLLRPTKEVLLTAGYRIREGDIGLPETVLAAIPLAVFGVWLFYWLGRAYQDELRSDGLPGLAGRIISKDRVTQMCALLDRKGIRVVVLGRLAVFPSSMMAAAAGVSGMDARQFHLADGVGALLSIGVVTTVGYLLGEAHERAGAWLTVLGVLVAVGLSVAVGRWLRRDGD